QLCCHECELVELRPAGGAAIDVRQQAQLVGRLERVQGVRGDEFVPELVGAPGFFVHGSTRSSMPDSPLSRVRSRRIACRVRLLTVPSGSPVMSAISLWV